MKLTFHISTTIIGNLLWNCYWTADIIGALRPLIWHHWLGAWGIGVHVGLLIGHINTLIIVHCVVGYCVKRRVDVLLIGQCRLWCYIRWSCGWFHIRECLSHRLKNSTKDCKTFAETHLLVEFSRNISVVAFLFNKFTGSRFVNLLRTDYTKKQSFPSSVWSDLLKKCFVQAYFWKA